LNEERGQQNDYRYRNKIAAAPDGIARAASEESN
jgi:hypothetical protein